MYPSDVLIHIDETLDDHRLRDLARHLSLRPGVLSACVPEKRRHLMLVDYDPENIRSGEILSQVRANGLHAEMIGL